MAYTTEDYQEVMAEKLKSRLLKRADVFLAQVKEICLCNANLLQPLDRYGFRIEHNKLLEHRNQNLNRQSPASAGFAYITQCGALLEEVKRAARLPGDQAWRWSAVVKDKSAFYALPLPYPAQVDSSAGTSENANAESVGTPDQIHSLQPQWTTPIPLESVNYGDGAAQRSSSEQLALSRCNQMLSEVERLCGQEGNLLGPLDRAGFTYDYKRLINHRDHNLNSRSESLRYANACATLYKQVKTVATNPASMQWRWSWIVSDESQLEEISRHRRIDDGRPDIPPPAYSLEPPNAPDDSDSDSEADSEAGSSHEQTHMPIAGPMIANYGGNKVMYDGRTAVMINGRPMIYSTRAEAQKAIRDLQQRANNSNRNTTPSPAKAPKVQPRPVQPQAAQTRTSAAAEPPRTRARAQPAQVYTTTRLARSPYSASDEIFEKVTSYRIVDDRRPDKVGVCITRTWQMPSDRNGNRLGSSTQVVTTVYMERSEFDRIISLPE
ncbi:hypothetical protein BJ138DRAFT_1102129 [Hygrophoropsis aurantiaca]|uniref:Uncharacterized protein n=1 Tax=Hygrophoropsis aurantiaca TaxID=72124 RepID=A0ACB8AAR1_9AGAM|nr:hypothetical protein BJ138DRAFT_1102129 [Hygrophoropsis aurantiaca]